MNKKQKRIAARNINEANRITRRNFLLLFRMQGFDMDGCRKIVRSYTAESFKRYYENHEQGKRLGVLRAIKGRRDLDLDMSPKGQ